MWKPRLLLSPVKLLVIALATAVAAVVFSAGGGCPCHSAGGLAFLATAAHGADATGGAAKQGLPRLVDLGADKCIPCKMMAPILEQMKKEYEGRLTVDFIDVWKNPGAGEQYGINLIPTQIFYDVSGKELFRHEGFFAKADILAKWKELGVDLASAAPAAKQGAQPSVGEGASFSRLNPAVPDKRPAESVCYMCDGDINPKTRVVLRTAKGNVSFCGPHCYFIMYSSLAGAGDETDQNATVTDWATGKPIAATAASYLSGADEKGRPTIKAFADKEAAMAERKASGGNAVAWSALKEKELANRCGFCDRAVYPEDADKVKVDSVSTWGCCPMCALGVAARMKKDIEVEAKDALTGERVKVKTLSGAVASLEPATAVAWAGMKKGPDGNPVSAGCFKQAFFANEANLKKWVEQHPTATGKMIPISQALTEKMKLTQEQISKACKIGECVPK